MLRNPSRLGAGLAATALGLSLAASPALISPAHADESTAAGCVAAGKVWLLVVTDADKQLANECVGTPKTGTEALQAADLKLVRDKSNFICTIGGYPAACPATYRQFWHYYTLAPGGKWTFSPKGADEAVPAAGSVQGWCYNAPKTKSCDMPVLSLAAASAPASASASASAAGAATSTADDSSSTPWGVLGTIAVLLAAGAGYLGWRRNQTR